MFIVERRRDVLQLRNVHKTFFDGKMRTEALRGISYTFPSRGLVFLVGKSGSGKSTLLNLLGGYDRPTSGKIIFCGKLMSKFSGRKLAKYSYLRYHHTTIKEKA